MENLKNPPRRVLINTIDHDTVGAFYDTVSGVNMLSFKQYGINIPYVAAAFKGAKACTDLGAVGSEEIELSNEAPCSNCNWQYGISVVKKVQLPGVGNNVSNFQATSYNGVIAAITTTGGYIDDKWLLQAEDDIISQIFNDEGLHNNNSDPVTGGGAIVKAVRSYGITIPLADTNVVNFTINGVTTPIVLNTGATAITMCADLNADATFAAHAYAIATSATTLNIVGMNGGDLFTIADGGGATTITINYRRIWLRGISPKVQFTVKYDLGFATTLKKYLYGLDGALAAAVANSGITLNVGGTASNVSTNHATITLVTAAINALALTGVYATTVGDTTTGICLIHGTDVVDSLSLIVSKSPGNYATYTAASAYVPLTTFIDGTTFYPCVYGGRYPKITGEYVRKLFANAGDAGSLAAYDVADQGDPTASYCMFYFKVDTQVNAIHGASYIDSIRTDIEVYIKSSLLTTDFLYSGTNDVLSGQTTKFNQHPTAAANINFEEVLQVWAGGTWTGTAATGGSNPNAWTN